MTLHLVLMLLNLIVRVCIAALVIYKLLWRVHTLNTPERAGLGLLGGAALLTLPPMLQESVTPFDDWSSLAFALGIATYLGGRVKRHRFQLREGGE